MNLLMGLKQHIAFPIYQLYTNMPLLYTGYQPVMLFSASIWKNSTIRKTVKTAVILFAGIYAQFLSML